MTDIAELKSRIDAELVNAAERAEARQREARREYEERNQRLAQFDSSVELFCSVWRPRLELLRQRFTELVRVEPVIKPYAREASFSFVSDKFRIEMKFSAAPDPNINNLILEYNLRIIPALVRFESHSELSMPLDQIDQSKMAEWLDDRIMGFVTTYVQLQGDSFFQEYLAREAAKSNSEASVQIDVTPTATELKS